MMGREFKAMRLSSRMSQAKWSQALGVSQSLISHWETDLGPGPTVEQVEKMKSLAQPLDLQFLEMLAEDRARNLARQDELLALIEEQAEEHRARKAEIAELRRALGLDEAST